MSLFDISRNEEIARKELTQQAKTLTLLRPLADLLNLRLKGEMNAFSDCDILAAAMWLFDNMLYFETRANCPGTTRQEAESVLVEHFSEAYPDWPESKCVRVAGILFSCLTPRDGYNNKYYDFSEQQHHEYFYRLIEWEAHGSSEVLYKLTPQCMILYAMRLEEGNLDNATASAMRAERTLRRNEINLAIESATRTITQIQHCRLSIDAGLRAARMGDTSITFEATMKPALIDAYDLLLEIVKQVGKALDTIQSMRKECSLEKRKQLHKAEDLFKQINHQCRDFKDHISNVHEEYDSYRLDIIGLREAPTSYHDLTTAIANPLLEMPLNKASQHIDSLLALMLPPTLVPKSKRKSPYAFDLYSLLNVLHDALAKDTPVMQGDTEGQTLPYTEPPPSLSEETIYYANYWVNLHLKQNGQVYFSDVIAEFDAGKLTTLQQIACLFCIGAIATSDKGSITTNIKGKVSSADIIADNLGVELQQ